MCLLSRGAVYCGFIVVRVNFNSAYDSDCCDPVLAVALAGLRPVLPCTRAYLFPFPAPSTFGSLGVFGHASTMASAAASRDNSSCNWPPAPPLLPLLPL